MKITQRMQAAFKSSGLTKAALARQCGVSGQAIALWLAGETKSPKFDKLLLFANATGVSHRWLMTGVGSMTNDSELTLQKIEIVDGQHPIQFDEIDIPYFREVEMSAGDGRTEVIENHGQYMRFNLERLNRAGVQPENAACATVAGNSMEPVLTDGSTIAIDKGAKAIVDGSIYALDHGGMLRVKRIYRAPLDRVRLVSDNAVEYPEEICSLKGEDAPKIIGRVFWWEVFA